MSKGNLEQERKGNFELKKRVVAATATIRTGRAADTNVIDVVVDIADPAADFTLTLPDGTYMGQEILIVMSANTSSKTCTLAITNHANTGSTPTTSFDAADEYLKLVYTGAEWDTIAFDGLSDVA